MINFTSKDRYYFADLQRLVEVLRAPGGCPWDGAQTHLSIRRNFLEEAYEACEGFDLDDASRMREELGDVLLQVLFHTDIERAAGRFDLNDVCRHRDARRRGSFASCDLAQRKDSEKSREVRLSLGIGGRVSGQTRRGVGGASAGNFQR